MFTLRSGDAWRAGGSRGVHSCRRLDHTSPTLFGTLLCARIERYVTQNTSFHSWKVHQNSYQTPEAHNVLLWFMLDAVTSQPALCKPCFMALSTVVHEQSQLKGTQNV